MSSSTNKPPLNREKLRVLVVCLEDKETAVRRLLGKLCMADWETRGAVGILRVPDNAQYTTPRLERWIDLFAPPERFCQVFFQKGIAVPKTPENSSGLRKLTPFPSVEVLEKLLPAVLTPLSLDWMSDVAGTVQGQWIHGTGDVDRDRLERWLGQFERLGETWIGIGLLQSLDFWSADRLRKSLGISSDTLGQFDRICVNRKRPGKSGDFLANILRKHTQGLNPEYPEVDDFWDLLDKNGDASKIMLVEDGLFTGTETTNFLSGMIGLKHPAGREFSTPVLKNKKALFERPVVLKYAVATSLGIALTEKFLAAHGLKNIVVCDGLKQGYISNVTAAGAQALSDGTFFVPGKHKILSNATNHLLRPCFNDLLVWKTEERALRAMRFCETIGVQLFRHYLNWKERHWEEERIQMCGLGMNGLGLTVAFNHSIPKASLPLLWMDGRIRYQNRELDWMPLFPDGKV